MSDPYSIVDFSGQAIREHYETYDEDEFIEGLSDEDLNEAGEWALNDSGLWDAIYASWSYGIRMVRSEKKKEKNK